MTEERLARLVAQGFGAGRGEDYKPWIRVTRGLTARKSNIGAYATSVHARCLHLLSTLERRAALVAAWLGASEIREQYPLFPWAHAHPLAGLNATRDSTLERAPALLSIAERAAIEHGVYPGSRGVPYVATTDLMLRFGEPPSDRLVLWSVKPAEVLADKKKGPRAHERIELERLYAEAIGARHAVFDDTQASRLLCAQLDWLEPRHSELKCLKGKAERELLVSSFGATDARLSIETRTQQAADSLGFTLSRAQALWRTCAWMGLIDADLSQAIVMSRPLRTGGAKLKSRLRLQLNVDAQ